MKKAIAVLWLACGVFNYSSMLGMFTHEFPWDSHRMYSIGMGVLGPIGVPASIFLNEGWHFRLKPLTTEERWQAFHNEWPGLSREEFEQEYD